jgi:hypothetical protein
MRIFALLGLLSICFLSCDKNDDRPDNNPNLIDPLISINLNLNLPEYNGLNFPGGSVIVQNQGVGGVVIYNVNNDLFTAFDLSDPNHAPNACSRMVVSGVVATCTCTTDDNQYDIVTGIHRTENSLFPMQQYRAELTGNTVRVSN